MTLVRPHITAQTRRSGGDRGDQKRGACDYGRPRQKSLRLPPREILPPAAVSHGVVHRERLLLAQRCVIGYQPLLPRMYLTSSGALSVAKHLFKLPPVVDPSLLV
jgi:hypothetical protein